MWPKSYKDYREDQELIKYQVEPRRGIIGCEMHEFNGWGISYHDQKLRRKCLIKKLIQKKVNFINWFFNK